jgi:hypothetical protein
VVTLEEEEVCLATWRHIMEVPETAFFQYVGFICGEKIFFMVLLAI